MLFLCCCPRPGRLCGQGSLVAACARAASAGENRPFSRKGLRMWSSRCAQMCDQKKAEIAWVRCDACGTLVCHWTCILQRCVDDVVLGPCSLLSLPSLSCACAGILHCDASCSQHDPEGEAGLDGRQSSRLCRANHVPQVASPGQVHRRNRGAEQGGQHERPAPSAQSRGAARRAD